MTAIIRHGLNLLTIYPNAKEQDPVKLCRKLRRLETRAHALALRVCNGPEWPSEVACESDFANVLDKVNTLLDIHPYSKKTPPVFINRDPRGCALKIREEDARSRKIHKDWGGYGIITPVIDRDGN
jgi:hypothetical protein